MQNFAQPRGHCVDLEADREPKLLCLRADGGVPCLRVESRWSEAGGTGGPMLSRESDASGILQDIEINSREERRVSMETFRARLVVSLLILATSVVVFGQVKLSTGQTSPLPGQARPGQAAQHPQQEPCWKRVGISSATMEEERSIQRESRAQIEAVCR